MEIKVGRTELMNGLGLVQSIVERKTTMPILANVLLEAKDKKISFTATDLEVGVNGKYSADVIKSGRIAIHARSVFDIIKELPDEMVHIKTLDGNWVEIDCGKSKFKIVGLAAEEFPALPTKGNGETKKIDGKTIKDMIEKVSFAMSSDETRYNLNGVYVDEVGKGEDSKVRMVATDGHRLSIVERAVKGGWNVTKGAIVPKKGISELKKLTDEEGASLDLWLDNKHMIAYKGNVTLVIRLIDGQFPPYEQVVPQKTKRIASVEREELIKALKRVSVISTDRTRGVKFSFSPKNLDIHAINPDMGEAHEEITSKYKGDSFDIGFNAKYMLDALSVISDAESVLQLGDETSPCLMKSESDRGFTHVIMPMRL